MCSICDVYGKILPEIAERVPSAPLMNDDDNDLWQRRLSNDGLATARTPTTADENVARSPIGRGASSLNDF